MEDDQTSDFNVPSTASEGLQCFSRNVTYNVTTTDDTQMTLAVPEDMSLEVGERDGPPEMYEECVGMIYGVISVSVKELLRC